MRRTLLTILTLIIATSAALNVDAARAKRQRRAKAQTERTSQSVAEAKRANSKAIRETTRQIQINTKETQRQLNALNLLSAEIGETDARIATIRSSVDSIDTSINLISDSINLLDAKVKQLQNSYASAIRHQQGHSNSMGTLAFIFSSDSFNQAYRRARYISQFSKWRKRRTDEIAQAQSRLDQKRQQLNQLRKLRASTLGELNSARATLGRQQSDSKRLVESLQKEGSSLRILLQQKELEAQRLDQELNRIIAEEQRRREQQLAEQRRKEEEARKARIAAEKAAAEKAAAEKAAAEKAAAEKAAAEKAAAEKAAKSNDAKARKAAEAKARKEAEAKRKAEAEAKRKAEAKPKEEDNRQGPTAADLDRMAKEDIRVSGDFESNRGNLPFPVVGKFKIVKHFGRQKHPELRYVETNNNGIDIEVAPGGKARAIYPGKVSAIFREPGFNTIVMVRHGRYLTIYAGLGTISVKTGDSVSPNQVIGTVYSDPDDNGRSILHFELRRETEKLNPEEWLR